MGRKLRILQVHNALYIPSLLSRGFRAAGNASDTAYFGIDERTRDLVWKPDFTLTGKSWALPQHAAFFAYAIAKYDVFHFWARPYLIPATYNVLQRHLPIDLYILKMAGKRISFQSDGCYPMIRPSVWKTKIDPEICWTCQTTQGETYGFCSNANTVRLNEAMNRYADISFGTGMGYDFEEGAHYVFPPVDLERWKPDIEIPLEFRVEKKPGTLLIYHGVGSHIIGNRGAIKGTDILVRTVNELKQEGLSVELLHVKDCLNSNIRFFQAQADLVVDQLLIGGGGQNARECLALGKPVLTRVHAEQWPAFEDAAAPHGRPPYVATDRSTLKENLVELIRNRERRLEIGRRSAEWARNVLSPEFAASRYLGYFESLYQ